MKLPTITIVTPVLNGAATLRQTIDSILQQEYPRLQYIVVDGGSTDGTAEILREYQASISQVIRGNDDTLYDAVAKGFDIATGDVLAWLNSDDLYTPGALLRVGLAFCENPNWQVIFGDDAVWKQGWLVANRAQRPVGLKELLAGHVIPQASTFFRRKAYEAVGGLERKTLSLAADYQLWLRLAAQYPLHFLPVQLSVFRIRHKQLSGDWEAYARQMRQVREGALAHGEQRPLPRAPARKPLEFYYPLENEALNWLPLRDAPPAPLQCCRCPICSEFPQRLMFSSPDILRGDRTGWRVYLCEVCRCAFAFPSGTSDAAEREEWTPGSSGVYSPIGRGKVAGVGLVERLASRIMEDEPDVACPDTSLALAADAGAWLNDTRGRLHIGQALDVAVPNIDSAYLKRMGPCWGGWNVPRHRMITGRLGMKKLAERGGFGVRRFRTVTPTAWVWREDRYGVEHTNSDQKTLALARRVSNGARLLYDWRLRGDVLLTTLVRLR